MSQNKKHNKGAEASISWTSETDFTSMFDEAYEKKNYKRAADLAAKACAVFPENWHFVYLHAEALYNEGHQRWETPHLDVLEKIERICDLITAAAQSPTASLNLVSPETDNGASVLRAFALQGKGDRLLLLKKGSDAHSAFLDAERQFMDVLERWPNDLPALTGYGLTLQKLGLGDKAAGESFELAKETFRQGMALDFDHGQPYVTCAAALSQLLMRNDEDAAALRVLEGALEFLPKNRTLLRGQEVAIGRLSKKPGECINHLGVLEGITDKKIGFNDAPANTLGKLPSRPQIYARISATRLKL